MRTKDVAINRRSSTTTKTQSKQLIGQNIYTLSLLVLSLSCKKHNGVAALWHATVAKMVHNLSSRLRLMGFIGDRICEHTAYFNSILFTRVTIVKFNWVG